MNAARRRGREDSRAEAAVERRHGAATRLFVYGSLAPGERNHAVLDPAPGVWRAATTRGRLHPAGWGAALGFPALELEPDGPPVAGHLLRAAALPAHWPALDRFEGAAYLRLLAVATSGAGPPEVANVYTLRAGAVAASR